MAAAARFSLRTPKGACASPISIRCPCQMSSASSLLGELRTAKFGPEATRRLIGFRRVTLYSDNEALVERLSGFEDDRSDVRVTRPDSWIVSVVPQLQYKFVPSEHNELANFLSRMRPLASNHALQAMTDAEKEIVDRVHSRGHLRGLRVRTLIVGTSVAQNASASAGLDSHCPRCQRFSGKFTTRFRESCPHVSTSSSSWMSLDLIHCHMDEPPDMFWCRWLLFPDR